MGLEFVDGSFKAKMLKDSISEDGIRLTTMEVTYPRIVLAEFNTHRTKSRNSASSRAIPVEKQIKKILENPFLPFYWGKNQKGMQADQELSISEQTEATKEWLEARDDMVRHAQKLLEIGVHKQITNRLLEPFMWHTVICTASEWENFFALRCHKDAQPEIRKISELMRELYQNHTPDLAGEGYWHLPLVYTAHGQLVNPTDFDDAEIIAKETETHWMEVLKKVSAGRCARVSYLTHDGRRDLRADIELCDRLRTSGHMSPLEHVARPLTWYEAHCIKPSPDRKRHPGTVFSGNFRGWQQFRKEIPNEENFAKVLM